MRAALLLVSLILAMPARGQDDAPDTQPPKKEKVLDAKAFLRGVLAAERKAFGKKPIEPSEAVRDRSFSSLKSAGTRTRYDKEYAKFVTEVEHAGLFDETYRMSVHVGNVSPAEGEPLFHVECTWTPMKRRWRYYMTRDEKQEYRKSTGQKRAWIAVQKVYTAGDKARDQAIESRCKQRKKNVERIQIWTVLSAERATDIRLVETAEIVGTIRDFTITYHDGHGHAVAAIVMDVSEIKVRKRRK
jgi:hypothetical protein